MLLHDRQELDDNLGGRTDNDLALAATFSIVDAVQAVVQDRDADHNVSKFTQQMRQRGKRGKGKEKKKLPVSMYA